MRETKCTSVVLADLDAFFVSVEQALRPGLSGAPCAVTGGGRQVVLSASYEARKYGVAAGMPVAQARRCCPRISLLPARMDAYRRCADHLFSFPQALGGPLERVSVDEAYWDVSGLSVPHWPDRGGRPGVGAASWLQHWARSRFGLSVSVGVAGSKSVAKIACEMGKPEGLTAIPVGLDRQFLSPLPVRVLPGVGPVAGRRLAEASLGTVGDLAEWDYADLVRLVGPGLAARLVVVARGEESDPVLPTGPSKSVSAEVTSVADAEGPLECDALFGRALVSALERVRARNEGVRTVTVTHRLPAGREVSASSSFPAPTDDPRALAHAAKTLHGRLASPRLRLVGVSFSRLSPSVQLPLDLDDGLHSASVTLPLDPPASRSAEFEIGHVAYRGLEFSHASFGHGCVEWASPEVVAVSFADRVRLLDPASQVSLPAG